MPLYLAYDVQSVALYVTFSAVCSGQWLRPSYFSDIGEHFSHFFWEVLQQFSFTIGELLSFAFGHPRLLITTFWLEQFTRASVESFRNAKRSIISFVLNLLISQSVLYCI